MDVMGLVTWIIIGGVAGWLASLVMKTREGLAVDIILAITGAFLSVTLSSMLGMSNATGFNVGSGVVAFIGAVIPLGLLRVLTSQTRSPTASYSESR